MAAAKLSRYLLPTLRQAPADADNVSAQLMQRAGMIRKLSSGIYEWLPLGLRVLRKVEGIVRQEMDSIGGQEVWLPVIQPKGLWEETGRWQVYGKELLRLKDRKGGEFCFAPTAEEVITDLVRREVRSWRQLPLMLYQFGLKFRDEIRPRFGVMRAREFLMKDAYSFHADERDASAYYQKVFEAYRSIFTRCGLEFRPVEAQSGAIGGSTSHEFMVLAETGEETVVSCSGCGYAANLERAEIREPPPASPAEESRPLQEFATPGAYTVDAVARLAQAPASRFIKTQLYTAGGKPVMALIRGDHELNEAKLSAALGTPALSRMSEEEYSSTVGCPVGFAGPQGHNGLSIVADYAVKGIVNGITGANKADTHARNVNPGRDFRPQGFFDLRLATAEDPCPRCGKPTAFFKGIEVGHAFKLGTKYSESLKAVYLDQEQKPRAMVMGCYGIGVSRVVAAAIEQRHDADGILWPSALSPFDVCLLVLDEAEDARVRPAADRLAAELEALGLEVLEDDRDAKAGVKFKDADLIGIPCRLLLSRKTLDAGEVEFKSRGSREAERWSLEQAPGRLRQRVPDPNPRLSATPQASRNRRPPVGGAGAVGGKNSPAG